MKIVERALFVLLVSYLMVATYGQTVGASLQGTVYDPSGATPR